jgi:hypothetical protein
MPEKYFGKVPGKVFGEIVLGRIWGSGLAFDLKFSQMGFH